MTAIVTDGGRTVLSCTASARRSPDRTVSQDAFYVNPQIGLFLVADGLGGHDDGDVASRAVAEIVRRVAVAAERPEDRRRDVEAALSAVNQALRREAARLGAGALVGSTVAVLLLDGTAARGLWVGDSRIYLMRAGVLVQLTRDHSLAAAGGPAGRGRQVLTRAVGSADELDLDGFTLPIESGDTLLLCSDGVSKAIDAEEISALLAGPATGLADRLVARAVAAGGRDDMTAVVVRVVTAFAEDTGGKRR